MVFPAASSVLSLTCDTSAQETIASHVSGSALEYVHVGVAEFFMYPELDERILKPSDISEKVKTVIQEIDIERLASGIAAVGTQIRFVVVTAATRDQSVWAVNKTDVGQTVSRVGNAFSAKEIIEREEHAYRGTDWYSD